MGSSQTVDPFNLSDAEFDVVMVEIDRKLRQQSDRIPGREMRGIGEYCAQFNITLANSHPTTKRIVDWFGRIYGDRLKMDWDFGRSIVLVQGEICRIRGIRFFGLLPLVCSPALIGIKLTHELPTGQLFEIRNLLENGRVQGLTPAMAGRLSADECKAILTAYARMFLTFSRLEAALGKRYQGTDAPFITEATHDLIGSVESLLTAPPNYGQSKWSSLQAVERVLKSCIKEKGLTPKKSHDLAELCATAANAGLASVSASLIASIQCSPDVRYEASLVSKVEAVQAHYSALSVCGELAPVVRRTSAQSNVVTSEFRTSNSFATDLLTLCYAPPKPPFARP